MTDNKDSDEILCIESNDRFVMFPIKYHDMYAMYDKAQSSYWTIKEIDFVKDLDDWNLKLTDNERYFIKNILAFFAASDGIVIENLVSRFCNDVKIPEARAFYAFQIAMETVHSETYSLMIDVYIKDVDEKNRLLHALDEIECVKQKGAWATKWINDNESTFARRLIAFAIVEGIFFSGAFCSIYWLKEKGLMCHGLGASNELIARDESLHVEFAVLLYTYIVNRVPENIVHEMIKEAVNIENMFINESIPCAMIGMNAQLMIQYINFVADRLLVQLGYSKIYNVSNPFGFMDRISLDVNANFFERRVTAYNKASTVMASDNGELVFDTNADF